MKHSRKGLCLILAALLTLAAFMSALGEEAVQELPEMDLSQLIQEGEPAPEAEPDRGGEAVPRSAEAPDEAPPADDGEAAVAAPEAGAQADPLRMNATEVTLGVKETFALKPVLPAGATNITFVYASSSAKVAPVSADGVITAKKKGTATITVTASTGETFTCKVTVVKAPKKITLNATSGKLAFDAASGVGTQYRLRVSFPRARAARSSSRATMRTCCRCPRTACSPRAASARRPSRFPPSTASRRAAG